MKSQVKRNVNKQINLEEEDEFELSAQNQSQQLQNKIKDKKSIANIYQELLSKKKAVEEDPQHEFKVQSKKNKKKEKKKLKKEQTKHQTQTKIVKKQVQKQLQKTSSSMKFINNKALQDELRKTTLKGVTKIFNLIAAHKKQMEA